MGHFWKVRRMLWWMYKTGRETPPSCAWGGREGRGRSQPALPNRNLSKEMSLAKRFGPGVFNRVTEKEPDEAWIPTPYTRISVDR